MATRIGERTPIGAFVEVQRGRDALRLIHPMIFADTPATIAPSGTSCDDRARGDERTLADRDARGWWRCYRSRPAT